MTRALLIQALDALTLPCDRWSCVQAKIINDAVEAIRARLAQPQSEPLFADMIAQHEGLAEELAEMDKPQSEPVALKAAECWPEAVMLEWDHWRAAIANGFSGSAPRDWFESLAEMRLFSHPAHTEACKWTLDDDEAGTYASACGELWVFMDRGAG